MRGGEAILQAVDALDDCGIAYMLVGSNSGNRSKDRDDIRGVIAVQGDRIDWDYVHGWCEQHGARGLLDEIRTSIPPMEIRRLWVPGPVRTRGAAGRLCLARGAW